MKSLLSLAAAATARAGWHLQALPSRLQRETDGLQHGAETVDDDDRGLAGKMFPAPLPRQRHSSGRGLETTPTCSRRRREKVPRR